MSKELVEGGKDISLLNYEVILLLLLLLLLALLFASVEIIYYCGI